MGFLSVSLEHPLAVLLFLVICGSFDLVDFACFAKHCLRVSIDLLSEELWADKVHFVLIGHSKETLFHGGTPLDAVDNLVREAVLTHNLCRTSVPDHQVVVLISRRQEETVWTDSNRAHCRCVERELDRHLHWEWLEVIG